jgi:hypothetical protein
LFARRIAAHEFNAGQAGHRFSDAHDAVIAGDIRRSQHDFSHGSTFLLLCVIAADESRTSP